MKINWKVRWKNKAFWAAVVPAALLLAQAVLQLCGVAWQPEGLSEELLALCDGQVIIPMRPEAESLNAAVAAAVVMWEIGRTFEQ